MGLFCLVYVCEWAGGIGSKTNKHEWACFNDDDDQSKFKIVRSLLAITYRSLPCLAGHKINVK